MSASQSHEKPRRASRNFAVTVALAIACSSGSTAAQGPNVFGGCDCSKHLQPKPADQIQQERADVVAALNEAHDGRVRLRQEFAKCALRQVELALTQKGPQARLLDELEKLGDIRRELLLAIARRDLADIAFHAQQEKECLAAIERIEAEIAGYGSEIAQLEQEKNQLYAEAEQLRSEWIGHLSVVNRDEFVKERLALLDQEIAEDPNFADGYLYRSLLQMQTGEGKRAAQDIREARQRMYGTTTTLKEKFRSEFKPAQIVDMVYASLLLGQEKPAWNYVEICRQRFPQFVNHPVFLHMKAKYEECENSYSSASDLYHEALKKVEGTAKTPAQETYNVEELYADAAWFYAATPAPSSRNQAEAMRCAEAALQKTHCMSWLAWRAVAAVKASEQDWDTALLAMERCRSHAPQHLDNELAEQVASYQNRKSFWIKRRATD